MAARCAAAVECGPCTQVQEVLLQHTGIDAQMFQLCLRVSSSARLSFRAAHELSQTLVSLAHRRLPRALTTLKALLERAHRHPQLGQPACALL